MDLDKQSKSNVPTLDRFHEIEFEKILEALEGAQNLEQQMAALFGTASIAILSVGFNTQKAGLLLLAGIVLWIYLSLNIRTRKYIAVFYYRGLQLQKQFAPRDNGFWLNILPSRLGAWVHELENLPKESDRIKALHKLPFTTQSISAFWIPAGISLLEVGLGVLMWLAFNWVIV